LAGLASIGSSVVITLPGHELPTLLLVAAVSRRKRLDQQDRTFVEWVAEPVATTVPARSLVSQADGRVHDSSGTGGPCACVFDHAYLISHADEGDWRQ
jgi:hypothetical protein